MALHMKGPKATLGCRKSSSVCTPTTAQPVRPVVAVRSVCINKLRTSTAAAIEDASSMFPRMVTANETAFMNIETTYTFDKPEKADKPAYNELTRAQLGLMLLGASTAAALASEGVVGIPGLVLVGSQTLACLTPATAASLKSLASSAAQLAWAKFNTLFTPVTSDKTPTAIKEGVVSPATDVVVGLTIHPILIEEEEEEQQVVNSEEEQVVTVQEPEVPVAIAPETELPQATSLLPEVVEEEEQTEVVAIMAPEAPLTETANLAPEVEEAVVELKALLASHPIEVSEDEGDEMVEVMMSKAAVQVEEEKIEVVAIMAPEAPLTETANLAPEVGEVAAEAALTDTANLMPEVVEVAVASLTETANLIPEVEVEVVEPKALLASHPILIEEEDEEEVVMQAVETVAVAEEVEQEPEVVVSPVSSMTETATNLVPAVDEAAVVMPLPLLAFQPISLLIEEEEEGMVKEEMVEVMAVKEVVEIEKPVMTKLSLATPLLPEVVEMVVEEKTEVEVTPAATLPAATGPLLLPEVEVAVAAVAAPKPKPLLASHPIDLSDGEEEEVLLVEAVAVQAKETVGVITPVESPTTTNAMVSEVTAVLSLARPMPHLSELLALAWPMPPQSEVAAVLSWARPIPPLAEAMVKALLASHPIDVDLMSEEEEEVETVVMKQEVESVVVMDPTNDPTLMARHVFAQLSVPLGGKVSLLAKCVSFKPILGANPGLVAASDLALDTSPTQAVMCMGGGRATLAKRRKTFKNHFLPCVTNGGGLPCVEVGGMAEVFGREWAALRLFVATPSGWPAKGKAPTWGDMRVLAAYGIPAAAAAAGGGGGAA